MILASRSRHIHSNYTHVLNSHTRRGSSESQTDPLKRNRQRLNGRVKAGSATDQAGPAKIAWAILGNCLLGKEWTCSPYQLPHDFQKRPHGIDGGMRRVDSIHHLDDEGISMISETAGRKKQGGRLQLRRGAGLILICCGVDTCT